MELSKIKKLKLPKTPGCYRFFDKQGKIIYIGKAVNLKNRILSYWQKGSELTPAKQLMLTKIERLDWIEVESEIEALLLEANLIKKYQPYYNVDLRDDKRFIYIKVALADEVPGVFATRKIDQTGQYFGPFVSTLAVRETLKAIRKIWPYCTARKIGKTPCFYYQIGRCVGVCGGKVSLNQYKRQVIKPIIAFLEGRKDKIILNLKFKISKLEKQIKQLPPPYQGGGQEGVFNELTQLQWQLKNMEQVLANARVLSVGEKYATDVVELAKILNLSKVPERIEGYDLSNIFGQEAVGSMVVFAGGEPNKNEYRKFKIKLSLRGAPATTRQSRDTSVMLEGAQRPIASLPNNKILSLPPTSLREALRAGRSRMTGEKHGDVQMLEEVLTRRFHHSPSPYEGEGSGVRSWPLPDLIVVDGGKAQLNTALKVLKRFKLDILVLGISKGLASEIPTAGWGASRISRAKSLRSAGAPDKIFFPGQSQPLQLPLNSPALHLLKRVRDESHRFAITYHRKLRSQRFLG